ncbi:MAG: MaoC family dehydratase [Dehalococcoidia bacterium]
MVEQHTRALPPEATDRIGREMTPRTVVIDDAKLRDYHEGLALAPPESGSGLPAVPTTILDRPDSAYVGESGFANGFGNLWMRQEWELTAPLERNVEYAVNARIVDVYPRRDRTVVNTELTYRSPAGVPVVRAHHHQSYLLEQSTGAVALRDPNAKEGARKFEVPAGDRMTPFERRITLEMCGAFFHGSRSYHTDVAASNDLGFRDVVVGGWMTMSYVAHLLERHFGLPWWTSGRLDVKFTNITWPGDTVIANGVTTGPLADDPGRTGVFAWLQKPDETVVLIATGSVATG